MTSLPVPYPADTRAKGWRFELDYEKVEQSDTWGLAAEVVLARPCLLMMWMVAWTQEPCGSLPNDEAIIRVRCAIPANVWPKVRGILMRGWWLADDGRLYHPTLTLRVLEMIEYRSANAKRVAAHKAAKREQRAGNALPPSEQHSASHTGTGTGTSSSLRSEEASPKYSPDFETAWSTYPKRPGASKADSLKAWNARLKSGVPAAVLLSGVERYARFCAECKTEPQFVKQPATFFGPGDHYLADWTPAPAAARAGAGAGGRHAPAAAAIFDMDQHPSEALDA